MGVLALLTFTAAPAHAREPTREHAVQALLDARVRATRTHDKAAFLATVDPQAPAAFRDAQARSFDGLTSVPVDAYRLHLDTAHTGDITPPGLAKKYGGAPTFITATEQRYRLRGYDDRDAVDDLWLTYVERNNKWYIAADDDVAPLGLDTQRNLWDLGAVNAQQTQHFLVLSHPDTATRAAHLADLAERAFATLQTRWTRPWSQRIPIILPSSVDELEVLLQSTFDLDNFVAFVVYGDEPERNFVTTAPRLFIQDRNLSRYSDDFQIETLVHELVHAATARDAGPFIPNWVHEGLADWVARGRSTNERPPNTSDDHLPKDYEFTTGGAQAIGTSYAESRSAMAHVAKIRGLDAPAAFFDTVGTDRLAPGSADYRTSVALQRIAGEPLAQFEHEWANQ